MFLASKRKRKMSLRTNERKKKEKRKNYPRKKNTIEKKWERNREKERKRERESERERENKKKVVSPFFVNCSVVCFLFFCFLFFLHRKLFDLEILLGDFVLKVVLFPLESDDPLMILDQNGLHVSCQNSKSPWNILLFQSRVRTILTGMCIYMCVCVCLLFLYTCFFFLFFPLDINFRSTWNRRKYARKNVCKNKNTCCHQPGRRRTGE